MPRAACLCALAVLAVAGCGRDDGAATAKAPQPAIAAIARGTVDQDGGLVRINAPREGVLDAVLVQEGDPVVRGQPLAVMDARRSRLALVAAKAEAADRAAQVQIAAAKVAAAERDAGRLSRLAAEDAATRQEADQANDGARIAQAEYRQAVQAAHAASARKDLEAYAVGAATLRAAADGRVLRRTAAAGASVAAGAPLFVMETDAPRIVRAEVDETLADKVRVGMAAAVSREFDSSRSYPAHVLRVAQIFGAGVQNDDPTARADTRVVTVIVALDGKADLKLGQRVLVRFTP
jgi:HlyD family secretion protein